MLPGSIVPTAPTLAKPFHRPGWVFEEKYDGWRIIAYKTAPSVEQLVIALLREAPPA